MSISKHGVPAGRNTSNTVTMTTMNTGAAAARRFTVTQTTGDIGGCSFLHIYNDGDFPVYFEVGAIASVDLTAVGGDDFIGPDQDAIVDLTRMDASIAETGVSFFCTSDAPTIIISEVD